MRKAVKRKKQKPGPGKRAERRTEYLREFYVFLKLLFFLGITWPGIRRYCIPMFISSGWPDTSILMSAAPLDRRKYSSVKNPSDFAFVSIPVRYRKQRKQGS
jgi:hypothetical protein